MIFTVIPVTKIVRRRDGTTYTRKLSTNERLAIMRRARIASQTPAPKPTSPAETGALHARTD